MSKRRVHWSMLAAAVICLFPVIVGVELIASTGAPLGWALAGFFGAGAVVLGRKAFLRD